MDETPTMRAGATDAGDAPSEAGARPTSLLPFTQLARISAYWLGLTAIDAAVGLYIGFQLAYTNIRGDVALGAATALVTLGGAVVAILVQPTVGAMSDYAVSRWGRRKPFIVFGSLLDLVFLYGIATSNTLLMLAISVLLLNVSTNIARGPFQGYVPDLVADAQVGMASAMVGMMQIIGNVTGYALISLAAVFESRPLAIAAVAIVELVTMVSVVVGVGKGQAPKPREGKSWFAIARETWGTDILRERSYVWLVASRLFFLMAGGILFAYVVIYLKNVFGYDESEAGAVNTAMLVVVVVGNLIAVVPASRLSDRVGRKPVIYGACLIGAVGVAITTLAPHVAIAILGAGLFGMSAGTFLAVDWALMTDIIPRVSAGRYMGLSNVATGSAPLFAAAVGGFVLDIAARQGGNAVAPRAAFLVAVFLYGVSALLLRPVVEPRRRSGGTVVPAAPRAGSL
ncbi:MAG: MFS transporter [Chloroflexota bacterium]